MSLEFLLEQFDQIIQTPADTIKANSVILQWAMRGHLVPQDNSELPAEELFIQIRRQQKTLVDAGKIKRPREQPPIGGNEYSYQIPTDWKWIRLGDIGDWGAGATPSRRNPEYYGGSIPWLKTGELNDGYISKAEEHVTELALNKTSLRLNQSGDVLLAMYGATIGKLGILKIEATTNQACCACTPFDGVFNRYLFYYLLSMRSQLRAKGAGGAQPNISKTKIVATAFPLPPYEEQLRIVGKIDELFEQTRELACRLNSAESQRKKFHTAVIHQLTEAKTPKETGAAWHLIRDNFDRLYTDPKTIAELKQAILQLAVMGRLVPQGPHDESADELVRESKTIKDRLLHVGKIRKRMKVEPLLEVEVAFEVPPNWLWTKLDNIVDVASGVTKGRKLSGIETVNLPYLRVANVQRGYLNLDVIKTIEVKTDEIAKYRLQNGDLLLTEGGDADKLGRSAIWRGQIKECIHQNHVFRARPLSKRLNAEWLMLCTNSYYGKDFFLAASKQTTNLASINMTQLRNFPVALPPISEQERILAEVDKLLAMCDKLAEQIQSFENIRSNLSDAMLLDH